MSRGINLKQVPEIIEHLKPFHLGLERRATKQEWYELQQLQARFAEAFGNPKIIYPEIAKEPRFTFDATGFFPLKTVFSIPTADFYLLGVLNSAPAWDYLKNVCSVLGDAEQGGRLTLQAIYVSQLPIPDAPEAERAAIAGLVEKCLAARGVGCEAWEAEINARVAALYGLS